MKAAYIENYGNADVLHVDELPKPNISNDELLIRVNYTSVNPVDWKVRKGMLRWLPGQKLPKILGGDIAGIVENVGKNVKEFKLNDKVYGLISAAKGGAYAEYAIAKPHQIAIIPQNISYKEAATIPLAALTAYQSLAHLSDLKAGQNVIVNGCSGGVGHFAVQIAKAIGALVVGVCSTKNIDFANELGADEVIDYTKGDILSSGKKYDIFFDAVAYQSFGKVKRYLNRNGKYVTTLPSVSTILNPIVGIFSSKKAKMISVKSVPEDLRFLSELVKSNKLKPTIDKTYALNDIRDAHRYSETGRVVGKLAVSIN